MTAAAQTDRRGRLALCFQEAFTGGARLRGGGDVPPDASAFRVRIKQLIAQAEQDARQLGYAEAEIRLAQYAVIVFIDEAVLHSGSPAFADWPRMPLQEEVFGNNIGGTTFYEYLDKLMTREVSDDVVDVLEVYQLCLLLGFRGRYRAGGGEVDSLIGRIGDRVQRSRQTPVELSPTWHLPAAEQFKAPPDLWLRRLKLAAAVVFGLCVLAVVVYSLWLRSGVSALSDLAS
jgi:type VI secretion system protein ImpK